MRVVHVASFSPTLGGGAGGGFEWRYELTDAIRQMLIFLAQEEGLHNLALVHVEVPEDLDTEAITAYIDENLDAVEPRGVILADEAAA